MYDIAGNVGVNSVGYRLSDGTLLTSSEEGIDVQWVNFSII